MPTLSPVTLSEDERGQVWTVLHRGKANARTRTRAQVLLKVADGWSGAEIAEAFEVSVNTVSNVCRRFRTGGVDAVLHDQRQQRRRAALTGEQIAHLVAIACTDAPEGHDHWTLRLLAGKVVELGYVRCISPETIRSVLKKTSSSRGSTGNGVSHRRARRT
ncbi:MAG TPA: helix-turn-helix domain-containing protein [Ktedonobacterales bacterium]|nr:helix-turn-helix domain-containing protein [Ktedonobacterales bacterium]